MKEEHVDVIETHLNLVDKVGKKIGCKAKSNKVTIIVCNVYQVQINISLQMS